MRPRFERARAVVAELRKFLQGVEEHALFSHAAATGFFLFFSIPPAALALVSLASLMPLDRVLVFLAEESREWVSLHVRSGLPPETGAVAVRLVDNALGPWFERFARAEGSGVAEQLQGLLESNLPPEAALALGKFVGDVLERPRPGLLTVGFVVMLWSAGGATRTAMRALNAIYEVRRHAFVRRVLVSLFLTLAILTGASFTLAAVPLGNAVAQSVVHFFDLPVLFLTSWAALNWLLGLAFMMAVVCALLRFGPNARQRLRQVTPGAGLTVLLWVLLGMGLRAWTAMSWENTNATYGTLAAVIVLLLWCYLVSAALLLGAELNAWLVERRGLAQRVVAGLALPYARRWSKLEPYLGAAPDGWLQRLARRVRRRQGPGADGGERARGAPASRP